MITPTNQPVNTIHFTKLDTVQLMMCYDITMTVLNVESFMTVLSA